MTLRTKTVNVDGAPDVSLSYVRGRWTATVTYERELRNGNYEDTTLVFRDLDAWDLRCIASSLHQALDDWGSDWHRTKDALRGKESR